MKLSLSGRLIEVTKQSYALEVVEFLELAKNAGYQGVHLRDGQIDHFFKEERYDELEALYRDHGLEPSMIWGGWIPVLSMGI